jgi:hypothetical protein
MSHKLQDLFVSQLKLSQDNVRACLLTLAKMDKEKLIDAFDSGYEQSVLEQISSSLRSIVDRNNINHV